MYLLQPIWMSETFKRYFIIKDHISEENVPKNLLKTANFTKGKVHAHTS